MRAVVLGGGGLTGRCTVLDLARSALFDEVIVADVDAPLAETAARRAGSRARAVHADVRDPTSMARVLAGADVCVNAVQYAFNLTVMEACLRAHVPVLDFGGLFHMTRRQLERDEAFRSAGLLAIPGLGQVPGLSNVLAAEMCADLVEVDRIILRDGWRDLTTGGPEVVFTWSPSTFLDEMVLPAQVWQDGAYREFPAMSGGEEFLFPEPVGRTRVYRTLHSEPATLPHSLREKRVGHCEWREGGPGIELLRSLALLGLAEERPIRVGEQEVAPRAVLLALVKARGLLGFPEGIRIDDWETLDIEVSGTTREGPVVRHAQARFPPRPDWQLSATEYAVGVCGAVGAEFIAAGQVTATGVVPPERCIPPREFRRALRERGIETAIVPTEPGLGPEFRAASGA